MTKEMTQMTDSGVWLLFLLVMVLLILFFIYS
jgi:hypothetical protein